MLELFSSFWDLLVSMLLFFFWIGALIALFTVIADLFRDGSLTTWQKIVWFVVPFLGTLIYLIVRGNGMVSRVSTRAQQVRDSQQEYIREACG